MACLLEIWRSLSNNTKIYQIKVSHVTQSNQNGVRNIYIYIIWNFKNYLFIADLGLPKEQLKDILTAGNFGSSFNFDYFTGVACLHLGGSVCVHLQWCPITYSVDYKDKIQNSVYKDRAAEIFDSWSVAHENVRKLENLHTSSVHNIRHVLSHNTQ